MSTRVPGKAEYTAIRTSAIVTLIAVGEVSSFNIKTDFEQLPFRIFPPMYAFYFIKPVTLMPAKRPFVYHEQIVFPRSATHIRIVDADGHHDVPIVTFEEIPEPKDEMPDPSAKDYCVFSLTGTKKTLIGKCDGPVLGIYTKIFGPASYAECEQHAKQAGELMLT